MGAPLRIGEACSFYAFRASNYKLHFLELPSGLKMVLNSDQDAGDLREHLQAIYLQVRHESNGTGCQNVHTAQQRLPRMMRGHGGRFELRS